MERKRRLFGLLLLVVLLFTSVPVSAKSYPTYTAKQYIKELNKINKSFKPHYRYFRYKSSQTKCAYSQALKRAQKKKITYINCTTASSWGLKRLGLSKMNFGFRKGQGWRGVTEKMLNSVTILHSGPWSNQTIPDAAKAGNLRSGDILGCTYGDAQHTCTYAGIKNGRVMVYDTGRAAGNYKRGFYISYGSKTFRIQSVIRWKK